MSTISGLADTIAGWLKPIPHLPTNGQKWIAENVWWITLIGVIISIFGIITLAGALLVAFPIFGAVNTVYGYYVPTVYTGWWEFWSVISLLFMIVVTVILAMAINPLKQMQKKGWNLLFLVFIIGVVESAINIIGNFNMVSFISSLISIIISFAIGAYFLNEIRSYFGATKTAARVTSEK